MTTNNHPAHGPLSNYRLHRIREILGKAAAQSDGGNLGYAMSDAVKAIDELLAGRKSEPVAWTDEQELRDVEKDGLGYLFTVNPITPHADPRRVIKLYRHAPPAPVAPATLPCAVELKPGLIIGKGCKTETLLTALQRRADYYAEIDAMTPEERAEHDANIEAFKAMLPQPAPVTVPECFKRLLHHAYSMTMGHDWNKGTMAGHHRTKLCQAVDECRAAMLNQEKSNG
ncbi:hypothetical protein OGV67_07880 [Citrobacter sp. CK188]|uniref:hypothetical protein n=1 Tax=Citrobacter sp. CK188 TaxID=2985097 RepID=UPI00257835FB|nr:hypothetical protein [Citrobacter sp. CK188]MDM3003242.1 hypothetical protein [Citrobacter sp. CK188]